MTTWKYSERRIAALVGGERVPVTGRGRGDAPDIAHRWLSISWLIPDDADPHAVRERLIGLAEEYPYAS